ncbi:MAG: NAD(P)H-dependent oxidoreductase subunit E [Bacillota bacterium]
MPRNCITPDDPRFREVDKALEANRSVKGGLIPVLHRAQHLFGYLPEPVLDYIARGLGMPAAEVYGVVTFYNFFSTNPVGRHKVNVCMGTACYVRGADKILERVETELCLQPGGVTEDGEFSLEVCRCVGACGLAPVMTVDGEVHGKLTAADVSRILAEVRQGSESAAAQDTQDELARTAPPAASNLTQAEAPQPALAGGAR